MEDELLAFPDVFPVETTPLPDLSVLAEQPAPEKAAVPPAATPQPPLQTASLGPFKVPQREAPTAAEAPQPLPSDPDVFGADGLSVLYRGRKDVPYGRAATAKQEPFKGIVMHHTGIDDLETAVRYGQQVDEQRGGSFGYHFYIGKDGSIVQGAPLSARTNHVKDPEDALRKAGKDLSNRNAIGISMVGMGGDHTPQQVEAAEKLARAIQKKYGISPDSIYGHGELQGDRQSREGMDVVSRVRPPRVALSARLEPALETAVMQASKEVGVSADYLRVTSLIESDGGRNKKTSVSGAVGPFQFLPAAWSDYGAGGDPTKPADAAFAAARMAKANADGLRAALGRDPKDFELYVAHQQGLTGARNLMSNPSKLASEVVGAAAVQKNGGRVDMTSAQFVSMLRAKYEEKAGTPVLTDGVSAYDISRPPKLNVAPGWTEASIEAQRAGYKETFARDFGSLYSEAYSNTTLVGRLVNSAPLFQPDPGWKATREDLAQIPQHLLPHVEQAGSQAEFEFLRSRALERDKTHQNLSEAGWKGTAALLLAGVTDPIPWVAGAGFGAAANSAVNLARLGGYGSRIISAAGGAAGNLAADVAIGAANDEPITTSQALFSVALGAGIGATLGHIATNPALRSEAVMLAAAAKRVQDDVLAEAGVVSAGRSGPSVGAALSKAPFEAQNLDEVFQQMRPGDVPKGAMALARKFNPLRSEGGVAATSESDAVRAVGGMLGVDVVGKVRGSDGLVQLNPFSADQESRRIFDSRMSSFKSVFEPAYKEWSKAQGGTAAGRFMARGRLEFNDQVSAYIYERDPVRAAAFPDPIKRAGDGARRHLAELLEDQKNPWREAGTVGRPVAGTENVSVDPHYLPRQYHDGKVVGALERHGFLQMTGFTASAIKQMQPDIDDDIAEVLGRAILNNKITRMYGMDDRLETALKNADREILKEFIREAPGVEMSEEQIERLMSTLSKRVQDGPKDARFKHRILLDESYEKVMADGSTLRFRDLLNTDVDGLLTQYTKSAAGSIALARTRYADPKTGKVLIDGITSDADFEALIRNVQKWEIENRASMPSSRTPEKLQKEVEGLRWMYDRIKGRPDPAQFSDSAKFLRTVRNYNTSRLMGMVGFAQAMDFGRPFGSVGMKTTLKHVGGFRRIVNMDGESIMKHGIDRGIETWFGAAADHIRTPYRHLFDETGAGMVPAGKQTALDKAQEWSGLAADVTMRASGFHLVNQYLKLVNYRSIHQKFSDLADAAARKKSDKNLLRFVGLEDALVDRVLDQVRKHRHVEDGPLFGRKITQMGWENWEDGEARLALQRAMYRMAANVVQENDVGAMSRFMSIPLVQTLVQFRTFNVVAFENMTLHGFHNFDSRQFAMMSFALMTGGLVYALQTQLQAIGRSDAEEFIASRIGSPEKLGLAALGRSGWTSLLPLYVDTALLATPLDPLFGNARASGQPSDGIFGNPSIGLLNDGFKTSKAIMESALGHRDFTQADGRAAARMVMLQNLMGFTQANSLLLSGLPEK